MVFLAEVLVDTVVNKQVKSRERPKSWDVPVDTYQKLLCGDDLTCLLTSLLVEGYEIALQADQGLLARQ